MLWRIHRDEHGDVHEAGRSPDDDERLCGESLVVLVDGDDVRVAGHRPERAERTVSLVVHRRLVAHAFEVGLPAALAVEERVAEIDVGDINVLDRRNGRLGEDLLTIGSGYPPACLVVEVCAADLQLQRHGRLGFGGHCRGNTHYCFLQIHDVVSELELR